MLRSTMLAARSVARAASVPAPRTAAARALATRAATPDLRVLVTGAAGQIGLELVPYLRNLLGKDAVLATDVRTLPSAEARDGPFRYCDVQDADTMHRLVVEHGANCIVHLASLLSATGEKNPQFALQLNSRGTENALEAARLHNCRVFIPSTIGAFGPSTPRDNTPDLTIMRPTTIYGITKIYTELLGEYYNRRWGVDFRSLRYPGIISNKAEPGGGTTDYAVWIYYAALEASKKYTCFLGPKTVLPMMYMPDCIRGTVDFLFAPNDKLTQRVYNMGAIAFHPEDIAASLKKKVPGFTMDYDIDPVRQGIANSWPATLDDSAARKDWGWRHEFDLDRMSDDMLQVLPTRLAERKAGK